MSEHYYSTVPSSPGAGRMVPMTVDGRLVELQAAPGVFSGGRLDPGTAVLLEHAPRPPATGTLLDLGCGYGAIACALALRAPAARVVAVDVNERARALTAANADALGLAVDVRAPEEVDASLRFAAVYSNPPIRVGKAVLHALLATWLGRLEPAGTAYLVVQRNLGSDSLHRWLEEQCHPTTRLTSVRGYRVLAVRP